MPEFLQRVIGFLVIFTIAGILVGVLSMSAKKRKLHVNSKETFRSRGETRYRIRTDHGNVLVTPDQYDKIEVGRAYKVLCLKLFGGLSAFGDWHPVTRSSWEDLL